MKRKKHDGILSQDDRELTRLKGKTRSFDTLECRQKNAIFETTKKYEVTWKEVGGLGVDEKPLVPQLDWYVFLVGV